MDKFWSHHSPIGDFGSPSALVDGYGSNKLEVPNSDHQMGSLETTKITGDFTMIAQPAIPVSISGEQYHGSSKQQKKVSRHPNLQNVTHHQTIMAATSQSWPKWPTSAVAACRSSCDVHRAVQVPTFQLALKWLQCPPVAWENSEPWKILGCLVIDVVQYDISTM